MPGTLENFISCCKLIKILYPNNKGVQPIWQVISQCESNHHYFGLYNLFRVLWTQEGLLGFLGTDKIQFLNLQMLRAEPGHPFEGLVVYSKVKHSDPLCFGSDLPSPKTIDSWKTGFKMKWKHRFPDLFYLPMSSSRVRIFKARTQMSAASNSHWQNLNKLKPKELCSAAENKHVSPIPQAGVNLPSWTCQETSWTVHARSQPCTSQLCPQGCLDCESLLERN